MIDEDIDIADEAEERQDALHEAAWDLIGKVEDYLFRWDRNDVGVFERDIRAAIARLEKILKGAI